MRPGIERLHAELKARIKPDDRSVPVREGGFEYHWQYFAGAQYRTWYRRPLDAAEPTVLLDEAALAAGKAYFNLRALDVSPDGRLLAYTTDEDGSERYRLHLRDLDDGHELADLVVNTSGAVEWAEDGRTLLYVELNDSLRPYRVRAHRLGEDPGSDAVVYQEDDPAFFVAIGKTRSRRFLVIATGTHVTREVRLLDAAAPAGPLQLVAARRDGHRYSVDHAHGRLWILTNDRHENFRLVSAPEAAPGEAHWREEIAGDDHHYLLGVSCFERFMVLSERADGLADLRLRSYAGEEQVIPFPESRLHGLARRQPRVRHRPDPGRLHLDGHPALGDRLCRGHARADRAQGAGDPLGLRRASATSPGACSPPAPDGAHVPITIVHRDDFPPAGGGPAPALRLRCLRPRPRPGLRALAAEPARPRHGLRLRPCPRRRRDGLSLVPRGQARTPSPTASPTSSPVPST